MKTTAYVLGITITTPIFLYIVWYVLKAIEASELTMFLFYIYIPVILVVKILFSIAEYTDNKTDAFLDKEMKKSFKEKLKEKEDERNK